VALMPFRVNQLTLAANPLKVREYLAAGLPVVSTAIPEVERLGVCRIGKDVDGVVREIAAAISAGAGPSEVRAAPMRSDGSGAGAGHAAGRRCAPPRPPERGVLAGSRSRPFPRRPPPPARVPPRGARAAPPGAPAPQAAPLRRGEAEAPGRASAGPAHGDCRRK